MHRRQHVANGELLLGNEKLSKSSVNLTFYTASMFKINPIVNKGFRHVQMYPVTQNALKNSGLYMYVTHNGRKMQPSICLKVHNEVFIS